MRSRFAGVVRDLRLGLRRGQKAVLVALAVVAGLAVPAVGDALAPLTTPIVVFLVFGSLRDARTGGGSTPSLPAVGAALGVSYVALPVVATVLGGAFLSADATTGVLVAVAAPTTAGSAIVWTRLGGGDAGLAAAVALVSVLLSPLLTPAILSATVSTGVSVDVLPVIRELLVVVCGAAALFWLAADRSIPDAHFRRGSFAAILVLVYVSVASSGVRGASAEYLGEVALATLAVVCVGLALVLVFGAAVGVERRRLTAIFFSSTLKNLGIGLTVAGSLGAGGGLALSVTTFYVVQQLASSFVAEGFRSGVGEQRPHVSEQYSD